MRIVIVDVLSNHTYVVFRSCVTYLIVQSLLRESSVILLTLLLCVAFLYPFHICWSCLRSSHMLFLYEVVIIYTLKFFLDSDFLFFSMRLFCSSYFVCLICLLFFFDYFLINEPSSRGFFCTWTVLHLVSSFISILWYLFTCFSTFRSDIRCYVWYRSFGCLVKDISSGALSVRIYTTLSSELFIAGFCPQLTSCMIIYSSIQNCKILPPAEKAALWVWTDEVSL